MSEVLHMEAREAREAKELLEHPMLQQAFEALRKDIFDVWATETNSTQQREAAYARNRALNYLEAYLKAKIDGGKVAQKELARIEKRQSNSF